jgi:hypothetical protein
MENPLRGCTIRSNIVLFRKRVKLVEYMTVPRPMWKRQFKESLQRKKLTEICSIRLNTKGNQDNGLKEGDDFIKIFIQLEIPFRRKYLVGN